MFNIRLTHCVNYLFYLSVLNTPRTLLCVCSKYILYDERNACTTAEILWGSHVSDTSTTEEENAEVTVDIW